MMKCFNRFPLLFSRKQIKIPKQKSKIIQFGLNYCSLVSALPIEEVQGPELFSPCNHKKWVHNSLLNFSVHAIVDQITGVNAPI